MYPELYPESDTCIQNLDTHLQNLDTHPDNLDTHPDCIQIILDTILEFDEWSRSVAESYGTATNSADVSGTHHRYIRPVFSLSPPAGGEISARGGISTPGFYRDFDGSLYNATFTPLVSPPGSNQEKKHCCQPVSNTQERWNLKYSETIPKMIPNHLKNCNAVGAILKFVYSFSRIWAMNNTPKCFQAAIAINPLYNYLIRMCIPAGGWIMRFLVFWPLKSNQSPGLLVLVCWKLVDFIAWVVNVFWY